MSSFILKSPDYLENIFSSSHLSPMQHTEEQTLHENTLPYHSNLLIQNHSNPFSYSSQWPCQADSFISISNLRIWESKGTLESADPNSLASEELRPRPPEAKWSLKVIESIGTESMSPDYCSGLSFLHYHVYSKDGIRKGKWGTDKPQWEENQSRLRCLSC